MSVEFNDFTIQVQNAIKEKAKIALEEGSVELMSQAMRNSRVDTGHFKGKWTHFVVPGDYTAYIGHPDENAIWEEYGTGIYAVNGNGRKEVPWTYQDVNGKYHKTSGKTPNRTLQRAFTDKKEKVKQIMQKRMKEV